MAKNIPGTSDDLRERFGFHPGTEVTIPLHEQIRDKHLELAQWLQDNLPDSREKSLAQTALQGSSMWSNSAVAIHLSPLED